MTTVYEVAVTDHESHESRGLFWDEGQANLYAERLSPLEDDSHSGQRVGVVAREIADEVPQVRTVWTVMGELEFQNRGPFIIADVYDLDHPDCPPAEFVTSVAHWGTAEMHSVHVTSLNKDEGLETLAQELKKLAEA